LTCFFNQGLTRICRSHLCRVHS